jgi:DNA-binding GntR family transcriptional regulator
VKIDETSPEHPYLQLAGLLRADIQSGKIANQLPSITKLTEETRLAVGTVRRAINILVQEGLVETVPGRGTFVIEQRPPRSAGAGTRQAPAREQARRTRSAGRQRPHPHIDH